MAKDWTLQDWRKAMSETKSKYSLCFDGEELGFSWSGCDICSNGLGGDLYKVTGFLRGKPTTQENSCDFEVCQDCICYIANGDEPDLPDLELEAESLPWQFVLCRFCDDYHGGQSSRLYRLGSNVRHHYKVHMNDSDYKAAEYSPLYKKLEAKYAKE